MLLTTPIVHRSDLQFWPVTPYRLRPPVSGSLDTARYSPLGEAVQAPHGPAAALAAGVIAELPALARQPHPRRRLPAPDTLLQILRTPDSVCVSTTGVRGSNSR